MTFLVVLLIRQRALGDSLRFEFCLFALLVASPKGLLAQAQKREGPWGLKTAVGVLG